MADSSNLVTVEFHGHPIVTIKSNGTVYVAMKPVAEAIGLDWEAQRKRIQRDEVLNTSTSMMAVQMPGDDQMREAVFLPLKMLNGWLFGVETSRLKNDGVREAINMYKRECFDVLNDYWNAGIAINPRMQYSVNPGDRLTKEQADILRNLLTDAAKRLPKEKQGGAIMQGWSKLKAHFKCSYREIPQGEFTEAVSIIARHVAEGEYIPAGATVDAEKQANINVDDLLLGGYSEPTVDLPPDVLFAADKKAVEMALESHRLCKEHLLRKVAYHAEMGHPRRISTAKALQVIADTTLAEALTHTFRQALGRLTTLADMAVRSANDFQRDIQNAKLA